MDAAVQGSWRIEQYAGKASPPPDEPGVDEHETLRRVVQRAYRAGARGFGIGLSLRGVLHLVSTCVQAARGKRLSESLQAQCIDAIRWAAALGVFGSVYVVIDEGIREGVGSKRSAHWRAAVAGAVAGPSIVITGAKIRRDELALYFLLRGVTLLVRCGNKAPEGSLVRKLLTPTRWRDGDSAMMCAATWQIIYSYVMMPRTLPRGYVKFLDRMAGFDSWLVPVARELALRNAGLAPRNPKLLGSLEPRFDGAVADSDFCGLLHPSHPESCNRHVVGILPMLFSRSLMVYLPVYIASAVAVHRTQLLKRPQGIVSRLLLGTARSSAFLAVYVASAHRVICWCNKLRVGGERGLTPGKIAMAAWAPGLAVLLEKRSRRMELALYCTCRAMLSFYQTLFVAKVAPRWLLRIRTDIATFALAMAAIMHCYSDAWGEHRDIFRSKYLNVLDFMFGGQGLQQGRISHKESNRELLWRASAATKTRLRSLSQASLNKLVAGESRAASTPP